MKKLAAIVACILLYSAQGFCTDTSEMTFPTAPLAIANSKTRVNFTVEVATTGPQLEHGLMFRKEMAKDHGMLFIFGAPQHIQMWMKNTIIPLDMLFVNRDGMIAQIVRNAKPESEDIIASVGSDITQVIELNGGAADYYHIATGDRVIYPVTK